MLPDLYVPKGKLKIDEWVKDVHDSIDSYYSGYYDDFREKDFDNYNVFNGIINKDQFEYVTDTYSNTNPARLVNYPIVKKVIDLLVGEWLATPMDQYSVELVNKDAVAREFDKKVGLVFEKLIKPYRKEIEKIADINLYDHMGMEIPDHIDVLDKNNYRENTAEVVYNAILDLSNKYDYKQIFKQGLYDLAITGKQFFKVDIVGKDPTIRRIDPRNIIYDVHVGEEDISKSEWVAEQRYMTASEILHEYKQDLTKDQKLRVAELRQASEAFISQNFEDYSRWYKFHNGYLSHIRVVTCEWRAIKTKKVKVSPNKYNPDYPHYKFLPDGYKKKPGEDIRDYDCVEVWESTRIGTEIITKSRPITNIVRREEYGYQDAPLSYVGYVQHNIDGRTVSFVDMMKQVAILYDITMYNIELVMQRSAGKAVVYDTSQIPEGLELDDVIYQAKNHGFIWINASQEGNQFKNGFNQFQSIDFTMSNSLTQLINLKMMLEQSIEIITGINQARMGMMPNTSLVGTTESKIVQSSYITQNFYQSHIRTIEKCLTRTADLLKKCWAGEKRFIFSLGDKGTKFLELMAEEDLSLNDYSIYIKNSLKDQQTKQNIVGLAEAALRGGQINFLDLVKILNTDTAKETERILQKSIDATKEANQAMQQQQMQMQQAAMQQQAQATQMKAQAQMDSNRSRVQAAQVAADGKVRAEEVEQGGKKDFEDHRFQRDLDRMVMQEDGIQKNENEKELIELKENTI
jgi:hypothetical protein